MGRLIDERTTLQRFIQETEESGKNVIHINTIKRILQDIDTAYDAEKVVEEIKTTFEQTIAEILDETDSEYTIADFNIKPYSNRICNVVKAGGVE